jgi:hypothetical protein
MGVGGQLHTPAPLPQGKWPPVPTEYEAGRATETVWRWKQTEWTHEKIIYWLPTDVAQFIIWEQ